MDEQSDLTVTPRLAEFCELLLWKRTKRKTKQHGGHFAEIARSPCAAPGAAMIDEHLVQTKQEMKPFRGSSDIYPWLELPTALRKKWAQEPHKKM
jgi:hypothetical protein